MNTKKDMHASLVTYIAFLRGINVGGSKQVKMSDLKKVFETCGFSGVKTVLNSGNVIFQSEEKAEIDLVGEIETALEKTFGFEINVLIRTKEQLQKIAGSDPFSKVSITQNTRLYITFLAGKPASKLKVPYQSPRNDFHILSISDSEIISVLDVSQGSRAIDSMNILEKEFGKKITTRNWNTINKLIS